MKQFKWKLDTSFVIEEIKIKPSDLFIHYLNGAANSAYKDGIGRDYLRRLFNISNKVEKAEADTIELEEAEYEFLKECFERAKFNAQNSKLVIQILDNLESVK